MIDFEIVKVFKRSITIEVHCDTPYENKNLYDVFINGEKKASTNKNVISIFNLLPDSDYNIYITCENKNSDTKSFHTGYEFVLLNVKDFGALGDGSGLDSVYIQAAINACPKDGTVYIPKGRYLCTPVFLKGNIDLWIDKDAALIGEKDRKRYPILPGMIESTDEKKEYNIGSWEGNPLDCFAALITGISVENVHIYGEGILDGNAGMFDWWRDAKKKNIAWRPNTVFLHNCKNIAMQGLCIMNSPAWTLHPYYSENLLFLNNTINNPDNSPNTDGLDPESCENVLILGADISVGDDCIAIKSGKYYMALKHYKPAKNIVIRNSIFRKGHGSVTIGSEVAAGVYDVSVEKCIFEGTDRGLRIKTRRGRGERSVLDNIVFENILMKDVCMPFTANMFYFCDPDGHSDYVQNQDKMEVNEKTPKIGKIAARDIKCENVKNIFACLYGLPEMPIEEIELKNITLNFDKKENIRPVVPIMMDNFPTMYKRGIFAKNIKKLILKNIEITGSKDSNPFMENIEDCECIGVKFN